MDVVKFIGDNINVSIIRSALSWMRAENVFPAVGGGGGKIWK